MMEIKYTLEILIKDIQDIEKLVGNLQNSPEGSAIEMDLALSKLRNVYEILTMIREDRLHLRKESRTPVQDEPIPQSAGKSPEGSARNKEVTERPEPIPKHTAPDREEPSPEQDAGKVREQNAEKQGHRETEESKTDKQVKNGKEAGILAEKFSTESSINENLATRRGDDMDSKLKGQPIDNISRNIGINDRFFIIRELFDGDSSGFRSLLDQLDGTTNFEDACQIIGERFPGNMEHEGVGILIQLARRRFNRT